MKKAVSLLICVILIFLFCSCGYSESELDDARQEGFDKGYASGYEAGKKYAVDNYEPHDYRDNYEPDPDDITTIDEILDEYAEEYGYYKIG